MFKPVTLSDKASFVSTLDLAVDKDRICEAEIEKHPEWREGLLSAEQLKSLAWTSFELEFAKSVASDPASSKRMLLFKDGMTPTVFVVGALDSDEFNRIVDETEETRTWRGAFNQRAWRMFLHGLRDIEGWPTEVPKRKRGEVEFVDVDWLKRTFIRELRDVAIQIGTVVLHFNRMTETETKN